jgi:hypothetical protein
MGHVEKSAGGIPLDSHILRLGQAGERAQGSGPGDLGLVVLVRCQVGDTADGIALNLDVRRHHLLDERLQPAELDD